MRTLIVTSALTFVPENYDRMICSTLEHSSVVGLLVLENRSPAILLKALALILTFSAPRMGWTLIRNYFGASMKRRQMVCKNLNKKIWTLDHINSPEALELLKNEKIDLLLNARTRFIFKKHILDQPTIGCINIHHGLLPEQRGLMCDFWAHLEDQDFGFSIHQMTSKIDDGPILQVVKVEGHKKNYLQSLLKASEMEAAVTKNLLNQIENAKTFKAIINQSSQVTYRKNPSLRDAYRLRLKGVKI